MYSMNGHWARSTCALWKTTYTFSPIQGTYLRNIYPLYRSNSNSKLGIDGKRIPAFVWTTETTPSVSLNYLTIKSNLRPTQFQDQLLHYDGDGRNAKIRIQMLRNWGMIEDCAVTVTKASKTCSYPEFRAAYTAFAGPYTIRWKWRKQDPILVSKHQNVHCMLTSVECAESLMIKGVPRRVQTV